jgi:hypothetical protein
MDMTIWKDYLKGQFYTDHPHSVNLPTCTILNESPNNPADVIDFLLDQHSLIAYTDFLWRDTPIGLIITFNNDYPELFVELKLRWG